MKSLDTALLREKFEIRSLSFDKKDTVVALSNRIEVPLTNSTGEEIERFIVRAQNMHQAVRMAARMQTEFTKYGPFLKRGPSFEWKALWTSITNEYERDFNKELWGAIYHEGKALFKHGEPHVLLDLIEKCVQEHDGPYEEAVPLAEDIFSQAGKDVKIEYDGNFALVINIEDDVARFAIILRAVDRTTKFNFSVRPKEGEHLNLAQCIMAAAAFLEGIQMAFMIGMNNVKILYGIIERFSREEKMTLEARKRLGRLQTEISNLENACDVRYRPEKPEIPNIVSDAEKLAEDIFEPVGGAEVV